MTLRVPVLCLVCIALIATFLFWAQSSDTPAPPKVRRDHPVAQDRQKPTPPPQSPITPSESVERPAPQPLPHDVHPVTPASGQGPLSFEEVEERYPALKGRLRTAQEILQNAPDISPVAMITVVGGGISNTGPSSTRHEDLVDLLRYCGLDRNADWKSILILRTSGGDANAPRVIACDLWSFFAHADTRQNLPLRSGDVVYVPKQGLSRAQWEIQWRQIYLYSVGSIDRETLSRTLN